MRSEKLGTPDLKKGAHALRFTCVGHDPESRSRETGAPGHNLGIDRISFRKLFPRT